MNRNLTLRMGNCNHRKYLWKAVSWVKNGTLSPERILTELEPIAGAIEAYEAFDTRQPGWIKVALDPTKQRDGREVATAATPNGPGRVHTH